MASKKKSKTSETKPKKKKYEVEVLNEFLVLPKRKSTSYKSIDNYIRAVYRLNEKKIEKALSVESKNMKTGQIDILKPKDTKASFKTMIYDYMEEGLSVDDSVKKLQNSTLFTPIDQILKRNLMESLKSKKMYNEFRKLNRSKEGKFLKFEASRLKWDKEMGVYYYTTKEDRIIVIEHRNSPEVLLIYELE